MEIYDRKSGKITQLPDKLWREQAASPYGWLENPSWSKDGIQLAFTIGFDGYPTRIFVAKGTTSREIQKPEGAEINGGLRWLTDGRLAFLADQKAHQRIFATDLNGKSESLSKANEVVHDFEIHKSKLYSLQSGLDHGGDLFVRSLKANPRRLTKLNPQIDNWKLPKTSSFKWKGPDGAEVEGILELPPGCHRQTLIHVGENDSRVPVTHSRSLHRALYHYIDAPCELLVYPKAGHGLSEYRHRLAKLK